jgi:DNA-binding response OmpR family regulator
VALQGKVPDLLVIVDEEPDSPCYNTCRAIRDFTRVPILVIAVESSSEHVAEALIAGADDHTAAPIGARELEARVRALLRRNQITADDQAQILEAGDIRLDCRRAVCSMGGSYVDLSPNEFRLARALFNEPGAVLSHEQLIENVWGGPYHASPENLRKLVQRLRSTLAKVGVDRSTVAAVAGFGYRFAAEAEEHACEKR